MFLPTQPAPAADADVLTPMSPLHDDLKTFDIILGVVCKHTERSISEQHRDNTKQEIVPPIEVIPSAFMRLD